MKGMYRVVIDTDEESNKLVATVDTRDEAIRQGILAKEAGARFVAIQTPLGKVPLESYLG